MNLLISIHGGSYNGALEDAETAETQPETQHLFDIFFQKQGHDNVLH